MTNPMDMTGKRILLYGSNSGIDKSFTAQGEKLGAKITTVDIQEIDCLEKSIKQIIKDDGPFDGFVFTLVNSDFRPLQLVKPRIIDEIFKLNFSLFIEALRALKKFKGLKNNASIVALSSISSIRAMKAKMAFSASKAALDASIRELALEFAEKKIRINSIQKGVVDVDLEKSKIQNIISINNDSLEKEPPLGITKSIEIANTILFLLSDATTTITGTSIIIDGGYIL